MSRDVLIIIAGVIAILILADLVIRLSERLMRHYGVSGGLAGLTVLSVGASLFEISTHVIGSLKILRDPDSYGALSAILIGSNIGSDLFQQNLLLPAIALVATLTIPRKKVWSEVGGLIAAAVLFWFLCLDGRLTRADGAALVLLYAAYLFYLGRIEELDRKRFARQPLARPRLLALHVAIVVGFALIAMFAGPVLDAATRVVGTLPISGSFFGVAVLGIAAAMPELSTAIAALRRGETDMAGGILIGSNVTNPMLAAGLGAMISTYGVPAVVTLLDLPIKIATGVLIYWAFWSNGRMHRVIAWTLIVTFFAYLQVRLVWFPLDQPIVEQVTAGDS